EWPEFARALDEACEALDPHLERPLKDVIWGADPAMVDQTGWTQPAMFAIGVALAALWRAGGSAPDLVAGHSVGEIGAARVAGVFSLEDAARLVAARARAMQALPRGGAMFAIAASEAEFLAALAPYARTAAIAAVNGPRSVVVSGDEAAVLAVARGF